MSEKENNSKKKKTKKEKIVYIDDGRSLADMSDVSGGLGGKRTRIGTYRDAWKTYLTAVRMMIVPMFITLGILALTFLIVWGFLKLATML